jgi:OmpA-OmpF porin, OOP family
MFHRIAIVLIILLFAHQLVGQDFAGVWQGMLIPASNDMDKADVIYITIRQSNVQLDGKSRIELMDQTVFSIKTFSGKQEGNKLLLSEKQVMSLSNTRTDPKCKLDFELEYVAESAYLKGKFNSSDCKRYSGTVILYRSKMSFNEEKNPTATHQWKKQFVRDYKKGYAAPEIRELERKNFVFKPIYFDHDQHDIKPEYFDYLNKMARVLDGHSDLRIKVTGHTDAVGSDEYNIGLSERRARAIKAYFLSQGIPADKLEIDFKGKRQPIDSNETPEGKQRNRRVDFEFI